MKNRLLTRKEENSIKEMAYRYYSEFIKEKSFKNNERMFGVEIEFSIIDASNRLVPETANPICKRLKEYPIKPEYGFLFALAGLYLFNQLVGLLLEYSYKSKSRVLNLLLSLHIIGVSLLVAGVGLHIWLVFYYN